MRVPEGLTKVFAHRLAYAETDWAHLVRALPYFRHCSEPDVSSKLQAKRFFRSW